MLRIKGVVMQKILVSSLLCVFLCSNTLVLASELQDTKDIEAPKWEEYVPHKYQNPRNFSRGKSIAELSAGILLTDLLITAPIGIPMIVHSTTKLKNKGYYDKKIKFEQGLEEAQTIKDPEEKQKFYNDLLKNCKMTEEQREKQLKKIEKRNKKQLKKQKENNQNVNTETETTDSSDI